MANKKDALKFTDIIKTTKIKNSIMIKGHELKITKGNIRTIMYNKDTSEMLKHAHEYTITLTPGKTLEISLQMYLNDRDHYRLFCYCPEGMLFSVNLTTAKESKRVIYLMQKLKLFDRIKDIAIDTKQYRRSKRDALARQLIEEGFEVSDNYDVVLGTFDPVSAAFVDTSPKKFLEEFIKLAVIKGHFMGNKGYKLAIFPDYKYHKSTFKSVKVSKPLKIIKQKAQRQISLGLRYRVLQRDKSTCQVCGKTKNDGVSLHIDHIMPFSKGGLTTFDNLQTLCSECNLGKSDIWK